MIISVNSFTLTLNFVLTKKLKEILFMYSYKMWKLVNYEFHADTVKPPSLFLALCLCNASVY
jgi:hypothetical protein